MPLSQACSPPAYPSQPRPGRAIASQASPTQASPTQASPPQAPGEARLSKGTLETLLDLVEIKISCMEVWDREDRRELRRLELARRELQAVSRPAAVQPVAGPAA